MTARTHVDASSHEAVLIDLHRPVVDARPDAQLRMTRILKQLKGELVGTHRAWKRGQELVTHVHDEATVEPGNELGGPGLVRPQDKRVVRGPLPMEEQRGTNDVGKGEALSCTPSGSASLEG